MSHVHSNKLIQKVVRKYENIRNTEIEQHEQRHAIARVKGNTCVPSKELSDKLQW